ncbi:/ tatD / putative TatD deoxyribonuclease /:638635 Reverse [Candidatus Hepatoplasma crinochetorum]|uniref:/ tatD / putative TatD deoxyribonuclease /:638635 Reverse n=1 Tax=Candidatus Hepatoplasma crinochetorum TaxID=295596 RepID=A0A0G7ZLT6_9MOLU|nr:/ tatD / putative TatD deoxyribonuclease /:638635 Reverse [Candidatus Hepatoplasma crinochetorum]
MKAIDTHAHLTKHYYGDQLDEVILKSLSELKYVFNIGTDLDSIEEILKLSKKYQKLIPVIGIHPYDVKELNQKKEKWLKEIITKNKNQIKAIGEIGLDYSRSISEEEKAVQKKWFIFQLKIAQELNLPVVIHGRDAYEDIYKIIINFSNLNYLIHSYTGSKENLIRFLEIKNLMISVNGIITFKNASNIRENIKIIPLERLLFETDCPYLTPSPFRGKINYPFYLKYTIEEFQKLINIEISELINITNKNAERFYKINSK